MEAQKFILRILGVILLIATCTLGSPQFPGSGPGPQDEFMKAMERLVQKSALNYNQPCSFEDEKRRTAIGEKLLSMVFEMNFSLMSTITSEANLLTRTSGSFCNTAKNLQCTANGRCDCIVGEYMGMKMNSFREENECRLAAGSACGPKESSQQPGAGGPEKPDLNKCQANSECIMKNSTQVPCTQDRVNQKMMDSFSGKGLRDQKELMMHTKKMAAEGICVCSALPTPTPENSSDSDSNTGSRFMSMTNWAFLLMPAVTVSSSLILHN